MICSPHEVSFPHDLFSLRLYPSVLLYPGYDLFRQDVFLAKTPNFGAIIFWLTRLKLKQVAKYISQYISEYSSQIK